MRCQGLALLYMDITQIEKKEKRRRDKTYTVALGKWKQLVGIFPLQGTVVSSNWRRMARQEGPKIL